MGEAIRILHVEDDPDFADLVLTFLEREDGQFKVKTAHDAEEGLACLSEREFHCIVSDYDMPGKNGLEFLSAVRENHSDLPFILFTGKGSESIASDAIAAGVTDYLQKGGGADTYVLLANRIRNAVESYQNEIAYQEAQTRFRILVEESADAIFIVAPDGTIEYATPVAEQLIGRPTEDLLGTNGFEYIHPDDVENVQHQFGKLVEEPDERLSVEFRFKRVDEPDVPVEARGRDLHDHPVIGGFIVYVRQKSITS